MAYECLRHPVYIGCVLGSDACASAFSRSSPQFAELVHGKLWTVSVKVSSLGLWSSHSFAMLCHKMFSIKVAISLAQDDQTMSISCGLGVSLDFAVFPLADPFQNVGK